MTDEARFKNALKSFDQYNSKDPNHENVNGESIPKELLYAKRMTEQLMKYIPEPSEYLQLAVRCQHVGRWEIARLNYPMDKKGYLHWRNKLKEHHAFIAEAILKKCGYDAVTIEKVKFLLLKKELKTNHDTQTLEDVACLVFLEYYIDEFVTKHSDEKVIDILRKTMKKMSSKALEAVGKISLSDKIKLLIHEASITH